MSDDLAPIPPIMRGPTGPTASTGPSGPTGGSSEHYGRTTIHFMGREIPALVGVTMLLRPHWPAENASAFVLGAVIGQCAIEQIDPKDDI